METHHHKIRENTRENEEKHPGSNQTTAPLCGITMHTEAQRHGLSYYFFVLITSISNTNTLFGGMSLLRLRMV